MFVSKNPRAPNANPCAPKVNSHAPNAWPNASHWNIVHVGYVTVGVALALLISSCLCNLGSQRERGLVEYGLYSTHETLILALSK